MDKPNEIGDGPRLTNRQGGGHRVMRKPTEAERKENRACEKGNFKDITPTIFVNNADRKCYAQWDFKPHKPQDKKEYGCGN